MSATILAGPWVMETAGTWERALDEWTTWLLAGARPKTTIYTRTYHIRRLATSFDGREPWTLTVDDLVGWLAQFQWKPDTRKSYRSSLSCFYGWAHTSGRTATNPAALLPKVHTPPGKPRPAPDRVFAAALARAEPRVALMLRLARFAGLRRAEIARVHRADVLGSPGRWWLHVVGKGGRERIVPLLDDIADDIRRRRGYAFPGKDDGHLSPPHVGKLMSRALPSKWTAHPLRHAFASRAYEESRDIRAVQELLGHASVATTQIYTAVPDGALVAAVRGASKLTA